MPEVSKDVQYMSGILMNGSATSKRGHGKESEVPMEERLDNLALNEPSSSSSQPKGEGMTHLLLQVIIADLKGSVVSDHLLSYAYV